MISERREANKATVQLDTWSLQATVQQGGGTQGGPSGLPESRTQVELLRVSKLLRTGY